MALTVLLVPKSDRQIRLQQEKGKQLVRSVHLGELQAAGEARATALRQAEEQLDRIARLLPDALDGGVRITEIARLTGVSRQTLYELRARYSDSPRDLTLAVMQALLTQYPATAEEVANHLGRSVSDVEAVLKRLRDEGFADWDYESFPDAFVTHLTIQGFKAFEDWQFEADGEAGEKR